MSVLAACRCRHLAPLLVGEIGRKLAMCRMVAEELPSFRTGISCPVCFVASGKEASAQRAEKWNVCAVSVGDIPLKIANGRGL